MYVNAFVMGILATLFVEMALTIIITVIGIIYTSSKKKGGNHYVED